MDIDAVPQEGNATLGGHRKAMYARDAQGRIVIAPSRGWEAEEIVTSHAVDAARRRRPRRPARRCAPARPRRSTTGCTRAAWTSRCCRRPAASGSGACAATCSREHFATPVAASQLARYADALGKTVDHIRQVPAA